MTIDDLPEKVGFHFDPACPWTWATSRWLVGVAERGGIEVDWVPLSLAILNEGNEVPPEYHAAHLGSEGAHRIFTALRRAGRAEEVRAVYEEIGRRVHHDGRPIDRELVADAARHVGVPEELVAAIDDEAIDVEVRHATEQAVALAGGDVGSPVLSFDDPAVAVFGPIVTSVPDEVAAAMLFEAAVLTARVPGFSELKRGREDEPDPGPRP